MNDKIKIKTELNDQQMLDLIHKFWELDENNNFLYKNSDLAAEFKMSVPKISQFCLENSKAILDYGHCKKCGNKAYAIANNKNELRSLIKRLMSDSFEDQILCDDCKSQELKERQEKQEAAMERLRREEQEKKLFKMEEAIKERRWTHLNKLELTILECILVAANKQEIYKRIFRDGNPRGEGSKQIWGILNRLEDLHLIWLKRKPFSNKIELIHTLPELKRHVLGIDSDAGSYYYRNDGIERTFAILLQKNLNKTNYRYPDYSGIFELTRDIVLKKGKKYKYGGWINDDQSQFLKITPYEQPYTDARPIQDYDDQVDSSTKTFDLDLSSERDDEPAF